VSAAAVADDGGDAERSAILLRVRQLVTVELPQDGNHNCTMSCCCTSHLLLLLLLLLLQGTAATQSAPLSPCVCGRWQLLSCLQTRVSPRSLCWCCLKEGGRWWLTGCLSSS
jgi:hypothetical protein